MKKSVCFIIALLMLVLSGCASGGTSSSPAQTTPATPGSSAPEQAAPAWVPTRPVTIVVPAGAGGGSDIFARSFAKIITDKGLCPVPVVVENRAGGSGAIAYNYIGQQKAGDPYCLLPVPSSFITTPLQGMAEVSFRDVTTLGRVAIDSSNVLCVPASSSFQTIEEFLEYGKANPQKLNFGGSQVGSADSILCYLMEKYCDVKVNYVAFDSGGEVVAALLGSHVDGMWGSYMEMTEYVKSGDLRILGAMTPQPLPGLDVPTFIELGYPDAVYGTFRGWVAPKDLPEGAAEYWEELIHKVEETPEWREAFLASNMLFEGYLNGEDFRKLLENEEIWYTEVLRELGLM